MPFLYKYCQADDGLAIVMLAHSESLSVRLDGVQSLGLPGIGSNNQTTSVRATHWIDSYEINFNEELPLSLHSSEQTIKWLLDLVDDLISGVDIFNFQEGMFGIIDSSLIDMLGEKYRETDFIWLASTTSDGEQAIDVNQISVSAYRTNRYPDKANTSKQLRIFSLDDTLSLRQAILFAKNQRELDQLRDGHLEKASGSYIVLERVDADEAEKIIR